jgi:hypothetical protein
MERFDRLRDVKLVVQEHQLEIAYPKNIAEYDRWIYLAFGVLALGVAMAAVPLFLWPVHRGRTPGGASTLGGKGDGQRSRREKAGGRRRRK